MSLKSLMEERQLDFNQPFLSVRKLLHAVPANEHESNRQAHVSMFPKPPLYKSDLKSGPMRNPGTVPFVWEQSPGRRKDENGSPNGSIEQPAMAPKLPPGRTLHAKHLAKDSRSDDAATTEYYPRIQLGSSVGVSNLERHVSKDESTKEVVEAECSDSEDGTDAYVDALDTLSRSESSFLNCSVSGVSGLDGPEIKPFGAFSTDPQARDLMMGRFLPAAKAMASENPPFTARKQPVGQKQIATQELPGHVQRVAGPGARQSFHPHRPDNIQHNVHILGVEESDDDGDDDDYGRDSSPFKICGLFPRMCLQNSLCILNPVPGMRKQAHAPVVSVRAAKRTQYHSSYVEARVKRDVPERQPKDRPLAAGIHENRYNREVDIKQIINAEKMDESSIYKPAQGDSDFPYHQKSHQSVTHEQSGFICNSERLNKSEEIDSGSSGDGVSNFRELLAKEKIEWESGSASPAVERTVYIDTVNVVRPQTLKPSSGDIGGMIDQEKEDGEGSVNGKENVETSSTLSSVQDVKLVHVGEKAKFRPLSSESVDSSYLSTSDIHEKRMDVIDSSEQVQDFVPAELEMKTERIVELKCNLDNCSGKSQGSMVLNGDSIPTARQADSGNVTAECKLSLEADNSDDFNLLLYLPPPLPKSPSESWLHRTLPTFWSRTPSSRSAFGFSAHSGQQTSKMKAPELRWETVVRTSNTQHGHLRFSEELLAPIPET